MISFILAMDNNRVIGKDNDLPWHIPADLQYFKRVTMGKPIIMGRKTYESIGRPLPGRENIVVTRDKSYEAPGCTVIHDIQDVVKLAMERSSNDNQDEMFVIGGAELFKLTFPYASRLYLTEIDHEFEGDTFFPPINESEWYIVSKEKGQKDDNNPYDYYFVVYERNK